MFVSPNSVPRVAEHHTRCDRPSKDGRFERIVAGRNFPAITFGYTRSEVIGRRRGRRTREGMERGAGPNSKVSFRLLADMATAGFSGFVSFVAHDRLELNDFQSASCSLSASLAGRPIAAFTLTGTSGPRRARS